MEVIEDVRKVVQDTIAPDLKALAVRVEELEKRMDERFQAVEKRFDDQRDHLEKRFDSLERLLNEQQVINGLVERVRFLETTVRATPAAREETRVEKAG